MQSLPSWQIPFLGLRHFPRSLTRFEIGTFFSFSDEERVAIRTRRGDHLRLAFGVHLGFLKMTGTTLNVMDRIPMFVLAQVSVDLDLPNIDIATVLSLYKKRKRTLYEHQQWAMQLLSIDNFNAHRQRALMRAFAPPNSIASDTRSTAVRVMCWLYTRGVRIPGPRRIQAMALRVNRRTEHALTSSVKLTIPVSVRSHWEQEMFLVRSNNQTNLEWLGSPPKRRSAYALDNAMEKLFYLRMLSVPVYTLSGINVDMLIRLSLQCRSRAPANLKSLRESTRQLEIVCFLRHTLLTTNDTILSLCDMRITDLRRHAREKANESERVDLQGVRELLSQTHQFAADTNHSDAEVRKYVLNTLPSNHDKPVSRAHRYREALSADRFRVRRLLNCLCTPRLECVEGSRIESLLTLWKHRQHPKQPPLNSEDIELVPVRWRIHITQTNSKKALTAFDCAVLTELRCGLRNGSVWAPESLSFLQNDAMLIDEKDWQSRRKTFYRDFNLPLQANRFLQQRIEQLESGLSGVAEAVEQNSLVIDEQGIHVEQLRALDEDRLLDRARNQIIAEIGTIQFPQIIMDIDNEVRFSWQLLQRAPNSRQELLAVYAALLAHGTARSVSEVIFDDAWREADYHWRYVEDT